MPDISSLNVLLHGRKIASLTLLPGNSTLLVFEEDYTNDAQRPTLSLSYKDAYGQLITDHPPTNTRVPPFFSNLLPEGPLRDYLAKRGGVKPSREFHLLWVLGEDLPGAVRILPADETAWPDNEESNEMDDAARRRNALRFSLAGVQLKFSAIAKAQGGLTIPASGQGGSWIVKLPSPLYSEVPENEYAMMELARMIGIDVPETRLVPINEIEGLPEGIDQIGGNAFVIKRFDRTDDGQAVHIEDFAQVFGIFPDRKYERANYRNIANVIATEAGDESICEFVKRLVFNALIGNADMHLKNWSLIYPDKRNAQIAPAYDFVATIQYLNDDKMALRFNRTKLFKDVNKTQLARFAAKAGLPEKFVLDAVNETVEAFNDLWPKAKKDLNISSALSSAIEKHRKTIPL
jgi:serine/threonine-protein kinase HipA